MITLFIHVKKYVGFALQYLQQANLPKLKMKWQAVGRILFSVSSFIPAIQVTDIIGAGSEKIRPRSWSDPELEC